MENLKFQNVVSLQLTNTRSRICNMPFSKEKQQACKIVLRVRDGFENFFPKLS
jgi:hypothetical protein